MYSKNNKNPFLIFVLLPKQNTNTGIIINGIIKP